MVTKQVMLVAHILLSLSLTKIHMVTKQGRVSGIGGSGLSLTKIHMVTKLC